jgi:apolipoprotein N-acyltransferase
MSKKQTYLLALFSAGLMWLAWPPHIWLAPLLFVGLVPLFIAIDNIINQKVKKTGRRIFLTAGLTFLIWNTACIYWVFNAINAFNEGVTGTIVAFFVSLIPYGLGALLMTFAFWLYARLRKYVSVKIAYIGLVCFYVAMEYLHESWDLAFPWMTLGNGFAGLHQLAQWYEFTGVYGGSVWILCSNILVFEVYKSWASKERLLRPMAYALAVIIVPAAISMYLYFNYEEKGPPINVVVVQPNIDPYGKFGGISPQEQFNILKKLSDSVGQVNTEFFIWPETAIPALINEDRIREDANFLQAQEFIEKYKNGSLLTGIESIKWYNDKKTLSAVKHGSGMYYDHFNAAIQIENSAKIQFYHKSKLVPGPEKLPFPKITSFISPVFEGLGGSTSGYGWQDHPSVFYAYSGVGVAPVICYESIWGGWIAQSVKDGAQFIAIITNDGWWGNTAGKDQHLLYAKLRAIETRRWVARSANTGISAFINQRGDIVKQSKWWTRAAIKADINLNDTLTLYTTMGNILPQLLSIFALLLSLIIPYNKWLKTGKTSG